MPEGIRDIPRHPPKIARPSLADDLGVDQLAHDGIPDEWVQTGDVALPVKDTLDLAGDVGEDLLEDPAGIVAVVLQPTLVVRVHAASAVAVSEDRTGSALLPPPYRSDQDLPETLRLEELGDRGDVVDVPHVELLRTGLGARVHGTVRVDAHPFGQTGCVGAIGRGRVAQVVEDVEIVGNQRDIGAGIVEPGVERLYAPLYELIRIGYGPVALGASGRYHRGEGQVGAVLLEVLVKLPLLQRGLGRYRRRHGVLVLLR